MVEKKRNIGPGDFVDAAQEALINYWWTAGILRRESARFFRALGFSESEFNILFVLAREDGLSQVEIGRMLLTDKSNITHLVDSLEIADLLERRSAPGDRRANSVVLTPRGRSVTAELEIRYRIAVDNVMERFSNTDKKALTRLSRKLARSILEKGMDHEA